MVTRVLVVLVALAVALLVAESSASASPRRIIRRRLNAVRACYEAERVRTPDLEGRLVLRLELAATGRLIRAAITSSTLDSPSLERCVLAEARRWPIETYGSAMVIDYPFVFRPAEPRDRRAQLRTENRACWDLALLLGAADDAHARVTTIAEPDGYTAVAVEETTLPAPAAECLARAAFRHLSPGSTSIRFLAW